MDFFQRAVTLLLTVCVMLFLSCLWWFYLSATSRDIAILTSNQAETGQAFLALKQQQDAMRGELDMNLNAIGQELRPLNEKASKAADVTRPPSGGSQ